jgi:hypothetical protein
MPTLAFLVLALKAHRARDIMAAALLTLARVLKVPVVAAVLVNQAATEMLLLTEQAATAFYQHLTEYRLPMPVEVQVDETIQ